MKKLLLIIALLISVLGLNAQSAIIDYGTYSLDFEITSTNPAECSLIGYSKMDAMSLTIPSTVVLDGNEYTVTSIGYEAFFACFIWILFILVFDFDIIGFTNLIIYLGGYSGR